MLKKILLSWNATKLSLDVIRNEKKLLILPILSGFFSLLYIIALLFPGFIIFTFVDFGKYRILEDIISYILLFLLYLGLTFISTFLNVGIVYITKNYFEGRKILLRDCFIFTLSKIKLILIWSLLSGIVGTILNLIRQFGENLPLIGPIISRLIAGILGLGWGIASIFVIPAMIYDNIGPLEGLKKSVSILKKTWGENVIAYGAFSIINSLLILAAIPLFIFFVLISFFTPYAGVCYFILFIVFVAYIVTGNILMTLIKSIFNVAIYVYASRGEIMNGYSLEVFDQAFIKKNNNKNKCC